MYASVEERPGLSWDTLLLPIISSGGVSTSISLRAKKKKGLSSDKSD